MFRVRSIALASAVLAFSFGLPAAPSDQFGPIGDLAGAIVKRPKFTDEDESRMAQVNAQEFESKNKMWSDPMIGDYVTGIVQKLVAVSERRPYKYRVQVVSDPTLNAFTFGGGLLYIHAGLVARLENEAQLAMVLSHEIAHVTARHVTKGIEKAYGTALLGNMAVTAASTTGVLPNTPAIAKAYEYSMTAAINGHGRDQERAADRVGMDYLVKAGYDPREGPITFELLLAEYGDQRRLQNFFYGSHPTNQERFKTLTELARKQRGDASTRLVVNTEEFKRATRQVVIATARLDYDASRFKEATAMFEKAVRVAQDDPVPHYYLGRIALETSAEPDAIDLALAHLQAAVKANAAYAPAHRELGRAYYRKADRPRSIASLEQYLALEPRAEDAAQIKAMIEELKRYGA
jgi:predicted Zn-dependent protease